MCKFKIRSSEHYRLFLIYAFRIKNKYRLATSVTNNLNLNAVLAFGSHSALSTDLSLFSVNDVLIQNHLTFSQTSPLFTCLQDKSFENTVGKGEIARYEQFLLFPQCFLPFWRSFFHFHQIKICRLGTLSVWKSLKVVV